ncbi:unnamed protein product [Fructobacillus fructosus]|nr:unnamed protein product [Fructobacillus fructosus]
MNESDNLEMLRIKVAIEKSLVQQTRWIISSQIVLVFVVMVIMKLTRG